MSNYCSVWGHRLTQSSAHKHRVMALCNGPIVSCHGSQSAGESSEPSRGKGHFTLNIHVVLPVIMGRRTLRRYSHTPSLCTSNSKLRWAQCWLWCHVFVNSLLQFRSIFVSPYFTGIDEACKCLSVSSPLTLTSRWYQIFSFPVFVFSCLSLKCFLTLWHIYIYICTSAVKFEKCQRSESSLCSSHADHLQCVFPPVGYWSTERRALVFAVFEMYDFTQNYSHHSFS